MKHCKRKRINRRAAIGASIFAVILILLVIAVIKTDKAVHPVAAMQAEHFAGSSANRIISEAVVEYIEDNRFTYGDFAAVLYDENGNTVSVEALPYNINKAQSELTILINKRLNGSSECSTSIPLGSLTGSYMLAGKGPHIKLRVCPVGNASVSLKSDFSSAGVNQTCHRIYAVITAEMRSSVPLYSFDTKVSFEFLLAESIIVGEVPEISRYAWNDM